MVAFRDTTEQIHQQQSSFHINTTGVNFSVEPTIPSPHCPQPSPSILSSGPLDEEEIIRFYFNMFDFDNTGTIDLDELKLVIRCICTDHSNTNTKVEYDAPTESDIVAMFEAMNTKKTGTIDYEEFKTFYNTLLITSSTRSRHDTQA